MRPPTSRVDFCAQRYQRALARHHTHSDVDAAVDALICEVARQSFVAGACWAAEPGDAQAMQIRALIRFDEIRAEAVLARAAAARA